MTHSNGLFTDGSEDNFTSKVDSIPLHDVDSPEASDGSIGTLVSSATAQISSLVRAEVELAKAELAKEAKKGAIGGGLFGVAGIIALYSSFFFFFFLAELLAKWMDRWAAFLIVFLIMIALAAIIAFIGYTQVKKIGKPKKTIESVSKLKTVVPGSGKKALSSSDSDGLFT